MARSMRILEVRRHTALLYVVLGLTLTVTNVLLAVQNNRLKVLSAKPDRTLEIEPGTLVPPFEGIDVHGVKQKLSYGQDERKTLFLVFSPNCGACKENMPNWKSMLNQIEEKQLRVVALSLDPDGVDNYVSRYNMEGTLVMSEVEPRTRVAYNLVVSPQMILVDSDGKVERVWTGVLESKQKQDLEQTLAVRFH